MPATSTKLLISIINRGQGERLVEITKHAGAKGGTILLGRGTAGKQLLQMLGLGDSSKDVVLTLIPASILSDILEALKTDLWIHKKVRGVCVVMDVTCLIRHAVASTTSLLNLKEPPMSTSSHELISVIVNAGYADDVMTAARKAGATGGTIINARGTGKEEDVKFFGITIVPEKELLIILADKNQSEAILGAVRALPCLTEPGIGIAFCINVEDFVSLGKTN